MRACEKLYIYRHIAYLNNDALLDETYQALNDTLGSDVDRMIDMDYSEKDIKERIKYEKYLSDRYKIYECCCEHRGIKIF